MAPVAIFVVGKAYIGKSSFCEYLSDYCGVKHISLGLELRRNEKHREQISRHTSKGDLIPSTIVIEVLENTLKNCNICLIDGFPRSLENVAQWESLGISLLGVIHLTCPTNLLQPRIEKRLAEKARFDDIPENVSKRLTTFQQHSLSIIDYYKKLNVLYTLDASSKKKELYSAGFSLLNNILQKHSLNFYDSSILKYQKLSENAVKPRKSEPFAAGFDIFSSMTKVIPAWSYTTIKTDIAFQLPPYTYGRIVGRSGLASKFGITVSEGVLDQTYSGEVSIILYNYNETAFEVKHGMRVAQLIITKINMPKLVEHEILETQRGAFGSSGLF